MIEKWKDDEDPEKWCENLQEKIRQYFSDDPTCPYISMDSFNDNLAIWISDEKQRLSVTLSEGLHDTTAMREDNMKFIIHFFEKELPYLQFEKDVQSSSDGDYWFTLVFKLIPVKSEGIQ